MGFKVLFKGFKMFFLFFYFFIGFNCFFLLLFFNCVFCFLVGLLFVFQEMQQVCLLCLILQC